jgi:uncharacterized protein (DUF1501 family)
MAISRREFLRRGGLMAAGSFLAPGWMHSPLLRGALADALGDKYFVVIDLGGGNDGLNTVVPYDDGRIGAFRSLYEQYRSDDASGGLRILQSQLADTMIGSDASTGTPLALHPALGGFKGLWDLGKLAIVQGAGYPEPSLSHAVSEHKWQSGDPLDSGLSGGWMGRYLATHYGVTDIPAVSTQSGVPGEFIQSVTGVLATTALAQFELPVDTGYPSDQAAKIAGYTALYAAARQNGQQSVLGYAGNVGGAMLAATQAYPPLDGLYVADRGSWNAEYAANGTPTALSLREVAKTIYGVVNGAVRSRFFEVLSGGYDTHSDQGAGTPGGQHYQLLAELGGALEIFYEDCADMGVADKLGILVWSEFGRRVQQNTNGTDHGTQAPIFVIGGSVNGGLFGNHPNIAAGALDPTVPNTVYSQAAGDPHRSTDFRDVYGTILKHWLGMSAADILRILPLDVGDPACYWTMPNFDLPFLP